MNVLGDAKIEDRVKFLRPSIVSIATQFTKAILHRIKRRNLFFEDLVDSGVISTVILKDNLSDL